MKSSCCTGYEPAMTPGCGNEPRTAHSTVLAEYTVTWADIAFEQYWTLPETARLQVDQRVRELRADPVGQPVTYDAGSDLWTVDWGPGAGLLVYAAVPARQRVIILRLIDV